MIGERLPTRAEAAWFQFRAACFRFKRAVSEWNGRSPKRLTAREAVCSGNCIAESRTVLFSSASPAEFALQAGKVHNLRLAARKLNGLIIPAGKTFSFWKNIGRATRPRGFVAGRELREGCVIPNIGGGLCQLSNALYDVALRANCQIVERHAHTRRLSGSTILPGRDATVFWNYVDLRFRPSFYCQLQVTLSRNELMVRLVALNQEVNRSKDMDHVFARPPIQGAGPIEPIGFDEKRIVIEATCETCGAIKCFRNSAATSLPRRGVTAWLLDKWEPEFDEWIQKHRDRHDIVLVPLKSRSHSAYRWNTNEFATVRQAPLVTVHRSLVSRRLATQGATRQRALLEFDRALANAYANKLSHLADHLVVSQNLLPHLWRRGDLGGRTFDVLMTRLPIVELEKILDRAGICIQKARL